MSAVRRSGVLSVVMVALLAPFAWTVACSTSGTDPEMAHDDAATPPAIPRPDTGDPKVVRGWESVLQRGCPACHQSPNASDGILSGQTQSRPGTMAYPANLTPDPDTGLDGWSADAIARAIQQGLDADGYELCTTMPRFADMKDDEAAAIAAYLLYLPTAHHPIPDSVCPPIKGGADEADDGASTDGSDGAALRDADAGANDAADDAGDAADG